MIIGGVAEEVRVCVVARVQVGPISVGFCKIFRIFVFFVIGLGVAKVLAPNPADIFVGKWQLALVKWERFLLSLVSVNSLLL